MKIVFCIPGNKFSDRWLHSWMDTIATMSQNGIEWVYSLAYDPVVYYARNRVLGGNNIDGPDQKPFRGQLDYDYQIWIDSDMVWTGQDVLNLIKLDKPIASGCYMMADNVQLPIVENLDWNYLFKAGTFKFLHRDELATRTAPFPASYAGFGFMAIKRGVIEHMKYPWFRPKFVEYEHFHEFTAEDVAFCWTAQELGYEIWVDPATKLGHEKLVPLTP